MNTNIFNQSAFGSTESEACKEADVQSNGNLLYREEVYNIVNCAMEVLNTLGCGLLEKPYENAMCVEFMTRQIPFEQQKRFNIIYKNYKIGEFIFSVLNKI